MKYIIFDFDGTVADTLPHVVTIGQKMLGITVDPDEIEDLRNATIPQIVKRFKIPLYKIPGLVINARKMFKEHIHEVEPIKGLPEVIKQLNAEGYELLIISSNSASNIQKFLQQHNLRQYFKSIYGNVGLFSKVQAIKKVMKKQRIATDDCVYIGDEIRDIEAAHKVGIPIISTTKGLNGEKILREHNPDFLAKNPREILLAIKKLG